MYKKIIFTLTLVAGLSSCNGDYTSDWVLPEQNTQQEVKTAALAFTPNTEVIDLAAVEGETVKLGDFDLTGINSLSDVKFTATNGDKTAVINLNSDCEASVSELKGAVVALYDREVTPRTIEGKVTAKAVADTTDTQNSGLVVLLETTTAVSFQVQLAPAPSFYFVVGAINGWSSDPTTPLFPGEDGNYSITAFFGGDHNLKFWNIDDLGNWGNAYGCAVDGSTDASGALVVNAGAIKAPQADMVYTFSVNLKDNTYAWAEASEQFPAEYTSIGLIGDFNGWGGDETLTQVSNAGNSHIWYIRGLKIESDGKVKFRANGSWDINWGGTDLPAGTGYQNGPDIMLSAATYNVYFNDITGQYIFIEQ